MGIAAGPISAADQTAHRYRGQDLPVLSGHAECDLMGEDVSVRLDVVPAQIRGIIARSPKCASRAGEMVVVQAPPRHTVLQPDREHSRPGP